MANKYLESRNGYNIDEVLPFVKKTYDLKTDVKLGWKPVDVEQSGAPIPLFYNFSLTV